MEADKEKIEEFFKKKKLYTNIREAYKNKGIFIDNFGNKILADRIPDNIPQNYPLDVFGVEQFGIDGVLSKWVQYQPKDLYLLCIQDIGNKKFVIPDGTTTIKNLTLLYDNDSRLCDFRNDNYKARLDYDDNYLVVSHQNSLSDWHIATYQKTDNEDYKKKYEFEINRDDIFNIDNQVLGIIDEKFYFCSTENDKIFRFNRYGQRETTINLPKGIKNTHTTLKALFNEIKTRYNDALRQHKINVDTDIDEIIQEVLLNHATASTIENNLDSANKNTKVGIPKIEDVIQEVLSQSTKPEEQNNANIAKDATTNFINNLDLSKKNKKLVENFIKGSRQQTSSKNIDPETQYNINLAKSKKAQYKDKYNFNQEPYQPKKTNGVHEATNGKFKLYGKYNHQDKYNFHTDKYKPQIRNITRDVEKNKWLTNKGWKVSK